MKTLNLNNGQIAMLDDEDFNLCAPYAWFVHKSRTSGRVYACTKLNGNRVYLHKQILNYNGDLDIDHINGDGLDNRRSNLRLVTRSQNNYNSIKRNNCSSKYKGVYKKSDFKWRAIAVTPVGRKHLGYFDSEVKAAAAYDSAAVKHFGEYARFNFPISLLAVALKERNVS